MTVLVGIFVGWIELIAIVAAGLVIPPENIGAGQAFFASSRAVSGTIASKHLPLGRESPRPTLMLSSSSTASIYLAIYTNRVAAFMPQKIIPAVTGAGLPSSSLTALFAAIAKGTTTAIDAVPGMNKAIELVLVAAQKRAYAESLKIVYLSSLSFGGFALITAFFASDVDKFLTGFVNKTVTGQQNGLEAEKREAETV